MYMPPVGLVVNYTLQHLRPIKISRNACAIESDFGTSSTAGTRPKSAEHRLCQRRRDPATEALCQNRHGRLVTSNPQTFKLQKNGHLARRRRARFSGPDNFGKTIHQTRGEADEAGPDYRRGGRHRPLVARDLARHYPVLRLSDRIALAPAREGEEVDRAELSDMAAVERMVAGVDGIVHLGGISGENEWPVILEGNIIGLYNVFEAGRRAGVKRIVFATSNHAVGFYPRAEKIDHRVVPRPDSRYGVSKAFGEALASLYSDKHGIGMLCTRIGNFGEKPIDKRRLSIWISPRDYTQLVRIGLEHPASDTKSSTVSRTTAVPGTTIRTPSGSATGRRTIPSPMPKRCSPPSRPAADPIAEYYQGGTFCAAEYTAATRRD